MMKAASAKLIIVAGGLALSLATGVGTATAAPDLSPFVNTTCSYPQVISALNATDPAAAAQFTASPMNVSAVQQFLAAPRSERQRMAEMVAASPNSEQFFGLMQQVVSTCNTF